MNREIKFRIWAETDKGHELVYLDQVCCDNGLFFTTSKHADSVEISQFTGLKDKNGKEIYEGDIVSDGYSNSVITWFKDECQFLAFYKENEFSDPQVLGDWAEVIGNVFETPNLLN